MPMLVHLINGPNLNLLGKRQPEIYGDVTIADVEAQLIAIGQDHGVEVIAKQSNHEGELVDWLQQAGREGAKVILNAGAYSHTSIAIHDAILSAEVDVMEVHVSNIAAREPFRHHSYVSLVAKGIIVGCGTGGYKLALMHLIDAMKA